MIEEYKWIFPNLFLNWCRRIVICNLKLTRVVRTSKDQGRWSFEVAAQTRTTTATKNTRSFQNKHQRSTQRPRKCLECPIPKTIPLHPRRREAHHKAPHHHSHQHHRNHCIGNRRKLRNKKNRRNRRRKRNRRKIKSTGKRRRRRGKRRTKRRRRRRRRKIKRRKNKRRIRRRKGKDIGVRAPVGKKGGDDYDDFLYQCSFG